MWPPDDRYVGAQDSEEPCPCRTRASCSLLSVFFVVSLHFPSPYLMSLALFLCAVEYLRHPPDTCRGILPKWAKICPMMALSLFFSSPSLSRVDPGLRVRVTRPGPARGEFLFFALATRHLSATVLVRFRHPHHHMSTEKFMLGSWLAEVSATLWRVGRGRQGADGYIRPGLVHLCRHLSTSLAARLPTEYVAVVHPPRHSREATAPPPPPPHFRL